MVHLPHNVNPHSEPTFPTKEPSPPSNSDPTASEFIASPKPKFNKPLILLLSATLLATVIFVTFLLSLQTTAFQNLLHEQNLAATLLFSTKPKSTPLPIPYPTVPPWKPFTSDNFIFRYPPDWQLSGNLHTFQFGDTISITQKDCCELSFSQPTPTELPLETWFSQYLKTELKIDNPDLTKHLKFSGEDAINWHSPNCSTKPNCNSYIFTKHNGNIYGAVLKIHDGSPDHEKTFFDIVDGLEFTDVGPEIHTNTTGWNQYQLINKQLAFSYPPEISLQDNSTDPKSYSEPVLTSPDGSQMSMYYIKGGFGYEGPGEPKSELIKIDGQNLYLFGQQIIRGWLEGDGEPCCSYHSLIYLPSDSTEYLIVIYKFSQQPTPDQLKLFDQILSTFQFAN